MFLLENEKFPCYRLKHPGRAGSHANSVGVAHMSVLALVPTGDTELGKVLGVTRGQVG